MGLLIGCAIGGLAKKSRQRAEVLRFVAGDFSADPALSCMKGKEFHQEALRRARKAQVVGHPLENSQERFGQTGTPEGSAQLPEVPLHRPAPVKNAFRCSKGSRAAVPNRRR